MWYDINRAAANIWIIIRGKWVFLRWKNIAYTTAKTNRTSQVQFSTLRETLKKQTKTAEKHKEK